jgi:hypothetical protein
MPMAMVMCADFSASNYFGLLFTSLLIVKQWRDVCSKNPFSNAGMRLIIADKLLQYDLTILFFLAIAVYAW